MFCSIFTLYNKFSIKKRVYENIVSKIVTVRYFSHPCQSLADWHGKNMQIKPKRLKI